MYVRQKHLFGMGDVLWKQYNARHKGLSSIQNIHTKYTNSLTSTTPSMVHFVWALYHHVGRIM